MAGRKDKNWVVTPRQCRRRRPYNVEMRLRRCQACGVPTVTIWHAALERFVPVLAVDEAGLFVFDMNPIFDKTAHRLHEFCAMVVRRQRRGRSPRGQLRAMLAKIGPQETASGGQEEEGSEE